MRAKMVDSGKTAAELDASRRRNMAYEYLCHLEEARKYALPNVPVHVSLYQHGLLAWHDGLCACDVLQVARGVSEGGDAARH
jgi:hypothetical protein